MECLFYVLFSPIRDSYYIGHTCDSIEERLRKHNSKHKGFTGSVADWQVAYIERFSSKKDAYAREREIKACKSRKKIEALIAGSEHSA